MRNKLIVTLIFIALCMGVSAQSTILTLKVNGIEEAKGMMSIALFSSEEEYSSKDTYTFAERVPVDSKDFSYTFPKLQDGVYAVKIYHDVNSDEELDTNWIGMPKEPFGFSNNAKGKMGPPSFEKASFELNGDTEIEITLIEL